MSNKNIKIIVEQEQSVRLDKFLSNNLLDITRSRLQQLIKEGNVSLNSKIILQSSYLVKSSDIIDITIPATRPLTLSSKEMDLDIVYEDKHLAIINKESGVTTHPGAGNYENTLVNGLMAYFKNSLSSIGGEIRPGIVHRLDKNTSGLIIIAKDDITHVKLSSDIQDRKIKRIYHALVWGTPIRLSGIIKTNIGRSKQNRKKMGVLEIGGKSAVTHYTVLEKLMNGAFSIVECELETGRTHQIRVHMSHLGNPIVGDPDYGNVRATKKAKVANEILIKISNLNRQMLHAKKLRFNHPITEVPMEYEIDLPSEMKDLILYIKNETL